ncbi:MAG: histidine phosphatase family protein [Acidobacteria bacterium]|nr:histidine phosphatase family protein [Acidobacteriota bacterium]
MTQFEKTQKWPDVMWIVRHGESAGNVARREAEQTGTSFIELPQREVEVPLSALGKQQAAALGRWFGRLQEVERPSVVFVSPYKRARDTAQIVLQNAAMKDDDFALIVDERLREKEFGIFDRITKTGVQQLYPEQAEARTVLGKFYYRPPGGESWCDVLLRLRSLMDTISREHRRERVLIVAHQVIVNCFRYLLEHLTEEEIMEMDRTHEIANCSVTAYEFDPRLGKKGKLALRLFNFVAPLEQEGAPITTQKDIPIAPK